WGAAPFQSLYQTGPNVVLSALVMPEWYLVLLGLGLLALLGRNCERLWIALPMFLLAAAVPIVQAWRSTGRASFAVPPQRAVERLALRLLTGVLYILQPIARLWGRIAYGLSPWRRHAAGFRLPVPMNYAIWSENWQAPARWLEALEK